MREPTAPTLVLAHGYGCDQRMWLPVANALPNYRRTLFDWPGAGRAHPTAYCPTRHASLDGYADDLLALLNALGVPQPVVVAHSVACSIAALAARREPQAFGRLVMVAPSPCFMNEPPLYHGGFERDQLLDLLQGLADGHVAWSRAIAPTIMGTANPAVLSDDLASSFCAMDASIALRWARATFLSDIRDCIPQLAVPVSILACRDDALAPPEVNVWMLQRLRQGSLHNLQATGHCPHMSAPGEMATVLRQVLQEASPS
jgi:sigma-B regulation protein RsbQ